MIVKEGKRHRIHSLGGPSFSERGAQNSTMGNEEELYNVSLNKEVSTRVLFELNINSGGAFKRVRIIHS